MLIVTEIAKRNEKINLVQQKKILGSMLQLDRREMGKKIIGVLWSSETIRVALMCAEKKGKVSKPI